jgi:hypothetical protein
MSTTPLRTAPGCSIIGIASGPPRTWIVNTPLPAWFAFLTYSMKLRE